MRTYQNPVFPTYFADPFVWKHEDKYYAVGTGALGTVKDIQGSGAAQNRTIPVLGSDDFVNWHSLGGALRVAEHEFSKAFWAPEVAYDDGWFYMYYSTAKVGLLHEIRVAKSKKPEGPYEDAGWLIGSDKACPFAIDAHPFRDDDGQWYLFYARDFLDFDGNIRAGTALVVDKLVGMTRLAGEEKVVMRSKQDWQLFKAQREMYGRVFDWHTMEGPCVRKRDGLYYCFYSGGCYENDTYGVDYGISSKVTGPYDDCGNEAGARVMRTVPGKVIGPGHHSIVLGPDGKTEYMAYHAWDVAMTARRLCLDKLIWTENGPRCDGPTWTPQEVAT